MLEQTGPGLSIYGHQHYKDYRCLSNRQAVHLTFIWTIKTCVIVCKRVLSHILTYKATGQEGTLLLTLFVHIKAHIN